MSEKIIKDGLGNILKCVCETCGNSKFIEVKESKLFGEKMVCNYCNASGREFKISWKVIEKYNLRGRDNERTKEKIKTLETVKV